VVLFELHEVGKIAYRAIWYLLWPSFALEMLVVKQADRCTSMRGAQVDSAAVEDASHMCHDMNAASRCSKHSQHHLNEVSNEQRVGEEGCIVVLSMNQSDRAL
jgi:hypothetical protein